MSGEIGDEDGEPRVSDVPRNDVSAAMAFARAYVELNGPMPPEVCAVLYRLQDDPAALAARLRASPALVAPAAPKLRYP